MTSSLSAAPGPAVRALAPHIHAAFQRGGLPNLR